MYRAVTWTALRSDIELDNTEGLTSLVNAMDIELREGDSGGRLFVNGQDVTDSLRDPDVERGVSSVSAVSGVRKALVKHQRTIAGRDPVVMAGRDIGTVVLPDAAAKIYLAASAEVRADRRYKELKSSGVAISRNQVLEDLVRRDKIDSERVDSPLRPAADAVIIDTDDLAVETVIQRVVSVICR